MTEKITRNEYPTYIGYMNEQYEFHNINDEPAIIYLDGSNLWYKNGKLHRTRGPAEIHSDGDEYWFYEDNDITKKVNQLMSDGRLNSDWRNWTEGDEFLFVLLIS